MLDEINEIHPLFKNAPTTTEFKKLRKRIIKNTREAIEQYGMIEPGARWLVCMSGGKDSYTLLAALYELKWRGLLPVELLACNLDQGQPGFPATTLPNFLAEMEIPHRIEFQDTYSVVKDKVPAGRTYCALCSRLRRGHLYRVAREENCTAIVLGHHRDDILETLYDEVSPFLPKNLEESLLENQAAPDLNCMPISLPVISRATLARIMQPIGYNYPFLQTYIQANVPRAQSFHIVQ